jgi:hypothetical protein
MENFFWAINTRIPYAIGYFNSKTINLGSREKELHRQHEFAEHTLHGGGGIAQRRRLLLPPPLHHIQAFQLSPPLLNLYQTEAHLPTM